MSLFRSAAVISGFTFLSRITGLLRDILIARSFGAGGLTDAFWVAFRIPNLLRRLFAEGAFSQAFVPILGEVKNNQSAEATQQLIDRVALVLTAVLMLVTLMGIIATPWVVSLMASGMRAAERQAEFSAAIWMTRTMFPYILCMSLVAFASGILNTWSRFAIPAFTPMLLNLTMIAASLWLVDYFDPPIYALAIGVMVGGILQLAMQWAALLRLGVAPRLSTRLGRAFKDSHVRAIIQKMIPATIGVSVAQISILINTNIATWLQAGSVTWLSFADRLMEFPSALLGVALGTVLLPYLSAAYARQEQHRYQQLLQWGLQLIFIFGFPAAVGLALLSEALVATLFNYGAFGAADVAQTQGAVIAYAIGLIGLLSIKVLAPAFYARQDIKTPVRIAIVVLVLTQLMNALFVPWLKHSGLALSIGLGACMNAGTLYFLLRRRGIFTPSERWSKFLLRLLPALLGMSLFVYFVNQQFNWLALGSTPLLRAFYLGLIVIGAGILYMLLLLLVGFRPRHFTRPR